MFIHGGLLHLAGNLLYLWIFGRRIEDLLGHGRFFLFYLVCGLAAAAAQVASDPDSYAPIVGASGAVSGLLGGYAVSYPLGRLRLLWPPLRVPAALFLLAWIALQLLSGLAEAGAQPSGVAWWAHVGGFVAGGALVRAMRVRSPIRSRLRS
jgi:membrane associated rhomboid family serine protease